MQLALIGLRGTGKSSVARLAALALGWDWADADVEVELRAGRSIAALFAAEGEPYFRDLEAEVVAQLARRPRCVLALGGGVVLRDENRQALAAATVVWLTASPHTLWQRIQADPLSASRRPPLAGGGPEEIAALAAQRAPRYRAWAQAEVNTEDKTPADVAAEILRLPLCAPLVAASSPVPPSSFPCT
jgi:shikimate kinase